MNQRRTISVPGWLADGVTSYQKNHTIQSWSQAALELMVRGLIHANENVSDVENISLGDEEVLWQLFEAAQENGFFGSFEDWLIASLKGTWGGERTAR